LPHFDVLRETLECHGKTKGALPIPISKEFERANYFWVQTGLYEYSASR
jgi:hypothetical protein